MKRRDAAPKAPRRCWSGSARAIDPKGKLGDALDRRAAPRRDRPRARHERAPARARRAHRVADRGGDPAPPRRRAAAARRAASPSSTSPTGSRRSSTSPTTSPSCATAGWCSSRRRREVERARADRAHHRQQGRGHDGRWRPAERRRATRGAAPGRGPRPSPAQSTTRASWSAPATFSASPASSAPGRTELARLIFGADRATSGQVLVRGPERSDPRAPGRDARGHRAAARGPQAPGDRRDFSVRKNITLAHVAALPHARALPLPRLAAERGRVASLIERLQIKVADVESPVGAPLRRQPAEGRAREVARVGRRASSSSTSPRTGSTSAPRRRSTG